ncbi:MAG: histidine triad nucleotide-binding protein [Clostridiaceae bacterium]|jgi:histidine triad (HIT) family protein|nr:histidine triad nucleotide-binding protein [Clostridiaceae bacterium]
MSDCIFCRIIAGEIPSPRLYEDEKMIVIRDINPQAPMHLLLIPKEHYPNIAEMTAKQATTLARCLRTFAKLADGFGLSGGFRIISNKGADACQTVNHLHIHILGGEKLSENMNCSPDLPI